MSEYNSNFLKSTDKKVLIGAALLILASMYYLLIDDTFFGLLAAKDEDTSRPLVGQIIRFENDTRHKTKSSFAWSKAKTAQQIRLGDSVFTGAASSSMVELKQGGTLEMSANTLIVFDDIKGLKVPNLKMGNFKIAVNGSIKVGIDNDVTVLKGNGSEVEISVQEKQKPTIRITKGETQVETKVAEIIRKDPPPQPLLDIKPEVAMQVPVPEPVPEVKPEIKEDPVPPPVQEASVQPTPGMSTYVYTDQMYDFYEKNGEGLSKRKDRRPLVAFPAKVQWSSQGSIEKVYGQVSETSNFDKSVQYFQATNLKEHLINTVYLGTNYWRLSKDGQTWSAPEFFVVESQSLDVVPPEIQLSKTLVTVLGSDAQVKLKLQANPNIKAFLLESSMNSEFPAKSTKVRWTTVKEQTYSFSKTGTYYIRARGVNEKLEVTSYGPVAKLEIVRPEKLAAPLLTKSQFQVYEQDQVDLAWAEDAAAKSYEIQIKDASGKVISQEKVENSQWKWTAEKKGRYEANVFSIDRYGRKSEVASTADLQVLQKPIVKKAVERLPEKDSEANRQPANVDAQSVANLNDPTATYLNRSFGNNRFEIMGAGFTMYSSEQVSQSVQQPLALTLGFRWQKWFGSHGPEASLRTKVLGMNQSASQASPLQAELRYNYRWLMNWNWFSSYKSSYFGLIGGYEMYRNQSSDVFASKYDLFKVGFSLAFPFASRWDTGGDVLYGFSSDSSTKYEISGYLNYYFSTKFSAGVGYRLHLFEAGSTNTAPPGGLPYREGYGEGYSSARWHF